MENYRNILANKPLNPKENYQNILENKPSNPHGELLKHFSKQTSEP